MYVSHLMGTFQCYFCVFCTLYPSNPRKLQADEENLTIIRRMNMDTIWSIEPSTTYNNLKMISLLISTCETSGFDPQLPRLGPFSFEDVLGFTVEFIMFIHSI